MGDSHCEEWDYPAALTVPSFSTATIREVRCLSGSECDTLKVKSAQTAPTNSVSELSTESQTVTTPLSVEDLVLDVESLVVVLISITYASTQFHWCS